MSAGKIFLILLLYVNRQKPEHIQTSKHQKIWNILSEFLTQLCENIGGPKTLKNLKPRSFLNIENTSI